MSRRLYALFCLPFALLNFSTSFNSLLFSSREYCNFSRCLIRIPTKTRRKLNAYIELVLFHGYCHKTGRDNGMESIYVYVYICAYVHAVTACGRDPFKKRITARLAHSRTPRYITVLQLRASIPHAVPNE
jgi:hypothetical protein